MSIERKAKRSVANSTWLRWSWPGSLRRGSVRPGSACLDSARLSSNQLGFAWLDVAGVKGVTKSRLIFHSSHDNMCQLFKEQPNETSPPLYLFMLFLSLTLSLARALSVHSLMALSLLSVHVAFPLVLYFVFHECMSFITRLVRDEAKRGGE